MPKITEIVHQTYYGVYEFTACLHAVRAVVERYPSGRPSIEVCVKCEWAQMFVYGDEP
jgi:hypothetical protein